MVSPDHCQAPAYPAHSRQAKPNPARLLSNSDHGQTSQWPGQPTVRPTLAIPDQHRPAQHKPSQDHDQPTLWPAQPMLTPDQVRTRPCAVEAKASSVYCQPRPWPNKPMISIAEVRSRRCTSNFEMFIIWKF
jgi:hypothetical protein